MVPQLKLQSFWESVKGKFNIACVSGAMEKEMIMSEAGVAIPKKFLIPVDFSDPSKKALSYGCSLAKTLGAEVHVVHVLQPPVYTFPEGAVYAGPELDRRLAEVLERQLVDITKAVDAEGVSIGTHLLRGMPAEAIVAYCGEKGCDLLVMGTHGRTGVARLLIGSVAERIVRTANIPVLTVSPDSK